MEKIQVINSINEPKSNPAAEKQNQLRQQIAQLVEEYAAIQYAPREFVPGHSVVPPSGKVLDAEELKLMVEASLDGWLTTCPVPDD